MPHDPGKYLEDVLIAANLLKEFTSGETADVYGTDAKLRSATERQFITIGEALNVLRNADPRLADGIRNLHKIIGFRNVLVHGYDIIETDVVWNVIENNLPELVEDVKRLLKSLGYNDYE